MESEHIVGVIGIYTFAMLPIWMASFLADTIVREWIDNDHRRRPRKFSKWARPYIYYRRWLIKDILRSL